MMHDLKSRSVPSLLPDIFLSHSVNFAGSCQDSHNFTLKCRPILMFYFASYKSCPRFAITGEMKTRSCFRLERIAAAWWWEQLIDGAAAPLALLLQSSLLIGCWESASLALAEVAMMALKALLSHPWSPADFTSLLVINPSSFCLFITKEKATLPCFCKKILSSQKTKKFCHVFCKKELSHSIVANNSLRRHPHDCICNCHPPY